MKNRHSKKSLLGKPVTATPVTRIKTPEQLLCECMPAFGGAYVSRIYRILDQAIGKGVALIIAVAGPVTVSDQHRAWLIPLIEAGWVAYITITDAACYHDGHDSLKQNVQRPIREVPIEGHDVQLRKQGIIRVTNTGFDESCLYDQDAFFSTLLLQPEFQRKMTGTEFRYLVGKYYDAQERKHGVQPGLLSTCFNCGVPVFVGAPGDGSAFLNSVKLWAMAKLGLLEHKFEIDIHAEVFESCAYHYWGLTASDAKMLAVFILGGGVPKNFSLQPEPTLSQIFMLPDIRGYDYDVQIVGSPVTYGDLTGCLPGEAVTWDKVHPDALGVATESLQTDYTTVVPLIVWALIEKRERLKKMCGRIGETQLFRKHPEARGFLRLEKQGQLRLFSRREPLVAKLLERIGKPDSIKRLRQTLNFPLAFLDRAAR